MPAYLKLFPSYEDSSSAVRFFAGNFYSADWHDQFMHETIYGDPLEQWPCLALVDEKIDQFVNLVPIWK